MGFRKLGVCTVCVCVRVVSAVPLRACGYEARVCVRLLCRRWLHKASGCRLNKRRLMEMSSCDQLEGRRRWRHITQFLFFLFFFNVQLSQVKGR